MRLFPAICVATGGAKTSGPRNLSIRYKTGTAQIDVLQWWPTPTAAALRGAYSHPAEQRFAASGLSRRQTRVQDFLRQRTIVDRARHDHCADQRGIRGDGLLSFCGLRFALERASPADRRGTHVVGNHAPHGWTLSRHVRSERSQQTTLARIVAMSAGQIDAGDRGQRIT